MAKSSHFIEGIILGALAGLATGVLFAPATGEETRRKLKEQSAQLKDNSDEWLSGTKDRSETAVNKTLEAIEQGFDRVSEMVDSNKKAARRSKVDSNE